MTMLMEPRQTVLSVFESPSDAQDAITALKDAGFASEDIGLAAREREVDAAGIFTESGQRVGDADARTSGILAGGLLGGLTGWLAGLTTLAAPGLGAILAAGPLVAALSGAGVGAAAGGLIGALAEAGLPQDEARWYDEHVRGGSILVTVRAGDRRDEALAILQRHGGSAFPTTSGPQAPIL